jgi:hypothetical protein
MPDIMLLVAPLRASVNEHDIGELEQLRDVLEAAIPDARVVIDVRSAPAGSIGLFIAPEALLVKILEGVAGGTASYTTQRALKAIEKWRKDHGSSRPVRVTDDRDREIDPEMN